VQQECDDFSTDRRRHFGASLATDIASFRYVTERVERQHYNVTLAALTFAGIAFALQQTMIIPALPELQRDLDTTTAWVTWLLTGFLLVASVATPLLGKLGDQYGKERLLLISLSVFFAGSVAAVFAPNIAVLIVCRSIQGVGAAVFPLSFSIIRDEFPPEKISVGVGVVSSVFAVGGGLGLVLSGLIVDNLSWRWLFVVGATGVGIALVLVHRFVPESPIKTPSRVDVPGAVLLSAGLIALLLALTEGESWGWSSGRILGLFALAAVSLVGWGVVETRVPEPMVDMRMLAQRTVLLTNVTAFIVGFAMFGSFVLVPNFVEMPSGLPESVARLVDYGFGASTTQAGLYLVPASLAGFLSGPLAGVLARRYGAKWPLALGMALTTIAIVLLAVFHDRPLHIVIGMSVLGAGAPLAFAAMAMLIVSTVRPTETGVATGVNTVMRTIGGVVGGQLGAAVLTADTIAGTQVPAESAFTTAFRVAAGAALLGTVVALFVTPGLRPRRLRGVQPVPGQVASPSSGS
jgi:EmrB/QacA subfamily drug resistance transporter